MPAPLDLQSVAPPAPSAADSRARSDNARGAAWMIASALGATLMTVAVRTLSTDIPTPMLAFLRAALGLWILAPLVLDGSLFGLRFSRPWAHLARGVLIGLSLNLGFYALAALPLTTATTLFFLAPIFATALSAPFLGERVGVWRWSAVAAGFLGALIVLRPGLAPLDLGALAAIGSSALFSMALLSSKSLARADGANAVMVSSTAVAAAVTLPAALPVWTLPEGLVAWAWIAALVAASSLRTYADIRAYALGEAGYLAPFAYLRLVFVAVAGWLLFRETPDAWTLAGAAVIIGATVAIARREARLGKRLASAAV